MSLDFVSTLAVVCLISLAAFSLRALPLWIWPLLAVSLLGLGDAPNSLLSRRPAEDREPKTPQEACQFACEEVYGQSSRYFITRDTCVKRCVDR